MFAHLSSMPLNQETIYLIETLKVEGYWSSKNFSLRIQNKNLPLLNRIEKIIKNLGIRPSKRILLKVKLEDNSRKELVKIIENGRELNFHIEKSPFDKSKVKAVTSLPYKKEYELEVFHKNNKEKIKIRVLKNKILYKSKLVCFLYGDLSFPTKKILDFLDGYCGKKKNFHVEDYLLNTNKENVMSAFSALIDCEGSIDWYGLKRVIRIRMRNKKYLEQWSKLLKKYNIGNKFRKNKNDWEIDISGWEDFYKLESMGFKLYNSDKAKKWRVLMKNFKRNQISRGTYKEFYIGKLKEINKKVSAKELSEYLKKSKRVVKHYLLKLERMNLISCDREHWPHLYFISTSSVR